MSTLNKPQVDVKHSTQLDHLFTVNVNTPDAIFSRSCQVELNYLSVFLKLQCIEYYWAKPTLFCVILVARCIHSPGVAVVDLLLLPNLTVTKGTFNAMILIGDNS